MRYIGVIFVFVIFCVALSLFFESCSKTDIYKATVVPFETPEGFPQPAYSFANNPITKEGFELGKKLFYEGRLSQDGNYPCGSCHQPIAAFTTYQHDLSHGFNHSHTTRNAPGLANLAWYMAYKQDGSAKDIETVSLDHINSVIDMGGNMDAVVNKLRTDSTYKRLFKEAYGDERINSQRLLKALSQFVVSLVSSNSKYDRVIKKQEVFTTQEQSGYIQFKQSCASCHSEPLFTDLSYRNIGLLKSDFLNDVGRMKVTGNNADSLKFRVPGLRNVSATSYYTHDGRFSTLKNMINHYRTGIVQSATLDPLLKNGIALSDTQVDELIAFLKTLTDSSFLKNPRFQK